MVIVVGSYALALLGHHAISDVNDLDLIGTKRDVARFRALHAANIAAAQEANDHRHTFVFKNGFHPRVVEIDTAQTPSDLMLADLCEARAELLGFTVSVPTIEALYILKRAHANLPVHYEKGIGGILSLKPLIGEIDDRHDRFYRQRKQECGERYASHRKRFSLALRNEDFFESARHIRLYEHDDIHEAIAYVAGAPHYKRCKHDLTLAKIDRDLFETLSPDERLEMVREEFMSIGLERYYLKDRSLGCAEIYTRGMHKTIRDLFVGYFQDFCIDNIDLLVEPPGFDFIARFEQAEAQDRLRLVETKVDPPSDLHKAVWQMIANGNLDDARRISEDMVRRSGSVHDHNACFLLGVVLSQQDDLAPAETLLAKALSIDRKNTLAWLYLGITLRKQQRYEDAVKALALAAQAGLKSAVLYWNQGLALEALGKSDEAFGAYRQAQIIAPEDPRIAGKLAKLTPSALN